MTIYVGLSGGVDSAVTAALLKKEGHRVIGVFIKGWYPPGLPCTWASDRRDAMRVAARLGISFQTLDASTEYKKAVIDYLIQEYKEGRTPNPDIFCNKDVKFGVFYEYARGNGADFVATGHYARTREGRLWRGIDEGKDQSYFLWAVKSAVLENVMFPLGGYKKETIRAYAKSFSLPVANKKDSQGICFLGQVSIDDFLRSEISVENGKAVDETGVEVGKHEGAQLYTLGERVALSGATPGPWYVRSKDIYKNELVVSQNKEQVFETRGIHIERSNFFCKPEEGKRYEAEYRYHGPRIFGTFNVKKEIFIPQNSLTEIPPKGQSLVLYNKDECVGGGIISS